MAVIFWITTVLCILVWIYRISKKDYFNILTYIVFGIYIPIILYFADWSSLFQTPPQEEFYWVFICLNIILLLIQVVDPLIIRPSRLKIEPKLGLPALLVLDFVYIAAMLAENYIGSGSVLPALAGIDIHTFHASLLFYITAGTYLILAFNTLYAMNGRVYLLLVDVLVIALLFVGKSARMDAFLAIVECISLIAFVGLPQSQQYEPNRLPKRGLARGRARSGIATVMIVVVLAAVVQAGVNLGNNRMNSYGKYDIVYGDGIAYTGPNIFGETMSIYYGYFPFSFYNLNNNIAHVEPAGSFAGLNSYRALYFGILQFDNIFDLPLNEANDNKIIVTKGATVNTGFWDFYYDYGLLCFIPMIVTLIIYINLRKRLVNGMSEKPSSIISYFYWVPLWFFMSFNNTVWDTCVIINFVIITLLSNRFFTINSVK